MAKIPNNYKTKTGMGHISGRKLWEAWTTNQKLHFLRDHESQIDDADIEDGEEMDWGDLRDRTQDAITEHALNGQYDKGGPLKGNQSKLDANHNGKIDAEDFKILRGDKKAKGGPLTGGQKKLDLNHNGKLDAEDFKLLRGEKKETGGSVGSWCYSIGGL